MPPYLLAPLVGLVAVVLGGYALAPIIWLTRSERALAIRRISGRKLLAWWSIAILPWIIALTAFHFSQRVSFSVNGVLELIGAVAVLLVVISALVSLQLFAVVLSVLWKLDRQGKTGVRVQFFEKELHSDPSFYNRS